MGNTCCRRRRKSKRKIVLLMLGLDNAGKTAAAKGLAGESPDGVVPTVGFSVTELKYLGHKIKLFDLGGGSDIRGIWWRYFVDAHGVIFVVDSSDLTRLKEVKAIMQEILSHEKISGKPVLLLANKQDHEGALDEIDIVENLNLESLVNEMCCPTLVESCSATENNRNKLDPGIRKGFDWLVNYIIRHYEILNKRVENDVRHQEILEQQARLEKIERLKREAEEKTNINDTDAIESYSDYHRKMNGNIKEDIDKEQSLVSDSRDDSILSDKSSDSFPPVYYARGDEQTNADRPKSAVQVVKEQIELGHRSSKTSLPKIRMNKTVPVSLYGVRMPRSADDKRKVFVQAKRNLKSAGDSAFFVTDVLDGSRPGPSGDDLKQQLIALRNSTRNQSRPSSTQGSTCNNYETPFAEKTGISIIDVD